MIVPLTIELMFAAIDILGHYTITSTLNFMHVVMLLGSAIAVHNLLHMPALCIDT